MQEHQLGWNFIVLCSGWLIYFHREIPESKSVVCWWDGKNRLLVRLELQTCDCLSMPPYAGDWVKILLLYALSRLQHSQIPNSEFSFVVTTSQKEFGVLVPRDHIDITVMSFERYLSLNLCCSKIPQLHCLIYWAGCQNMLLGWRELNIFDWLFVTLQTNL